MPVLPARARTQLLGAVQQAGIEIGVHLHVALQTLFGLSELRQQPGFGIDLPDAALDRGLLVQYRDDGRVVFGKAGGQVVALLLKLGQHAFRIDRLLQYGGALFPEIERGVLRAERVVRVFRRFELALEQRQLLIEKGNRLLRFRRFSVEVLAHVLLADRRQDLTGTQRIGALQAGLDHIRFLGRLYDPQVLLQRFDGAHHRDPRQREGAAGFRGQRRDGQRERAVGGLHGERLAHASGRPEVRAAIVERVFAAASRDQRERLAHQARRRIERRHVGALPTPYVAALPKETGRRQAGLARRPPAPEDGKVLRLHVDVEPHLFDRRRQHQPRLQDVDLVGRGGLDIEHARHTRQHVGGRSRGQVVLDLDQDVRLVDRRCQNRVADAGQRRDESNRTDQETAVVERVEQRIGVDETVVRLGPRRRRREHHEAFAARSIERGRLEGSVGRSIHVTAPASTG